jgi:hypothetical protein
MATGGHDIASRYGVWADTYNDYAAGVGQFVAVDVAAAEAAYRTMIAEPERRRAMAATAREHARRTYEWRVVMGQYRALWDELARLRREAAKGGERAPPVEGRERVPLRPNPFSVFAAYPTRRLAPGMRFALAPGASFETLKTYASVPGAVVRGQLLPTVPDLEAAMRRLGRGGPATIEEIIAVVPAPRRPRLARALAWMAKLDLVRVVE